MLFDAAPIISAVHINFHKYDSSAGLSLTAYFPDSQMYLCPEAERNVILDMLHDIGLQIE